MKKFILILISLIPYFGFTQVSLHKWTFNTKDSLVNADATVSTGTKMPQIGNGAIQLSGTVINTFSDGVVNDSSSIGDNSAIQLATFPANGTKRDTSGIIFKISTSGIVICSSHGTKGTQQLRVNLLNYCTQLTV